MSMDTGGPAFPTGAQQDRYGDFVSGDEGMTLRDYFAAVAMPAAMAVFRHPDAVADESYKYADAMIRARNK